MVRSSFIWQALWEGLFAALHLAEWQMGTHRERGFTDCLSRFPWEGVGVRNRECSRLQDRQQQSFGLGD